MKMSIFGKGRKKWLTIATMLLTILLPATVVATVIIQYQISGIVSSASSPVIFANGENYVSINTLGFGYNAYNTPYTSAKIFINGTAGAYGTYLADELNVTQNGKQPANTWTVSFVEPAPLTEVGPIIDAFAFIAENATVSGVSSVSVARGGAGTVNAWNIFVPTYTDKLGPYPAAGVAATDGYANVEVLNLTNGAISTISTLTTHAAGIGAYVTYFSFVTGKLPSSFLSITFVMVISSGAATPLATSGTFTLTMTVTS